MPHLRSRLLAEFVGKAFLLMGVVSSGIMAEKLTDDVGLQLFQNAFATAGVLIAIANIMFECPVQVYAGQNIQQVASARWAVFGYHRFA